MLAYKRKYVKKIFEIFIIAFGFLQLSLRLVFSAQSSIKLAEDHVSQTHEMLVSDNHEDILKVLLTVQELLTILLLAFENMPSAISVVRELSRQRAETEVLRKVMEESVEVYTIHGSLPDSFAIETQRCHDSYRECIRLLECVYIQAGKSDVKSDFELDIEEFWMILRDVITKKQRREAYISFRDSVWRLRNLASDAKIQKQLSEMSSGILELLDCGEDDESVFEQPYDGEASAPTSAPALLSATTWDPQASTRPRNASLELHPKPRSKLANQRRPLIQANSNFTVDVTLVFSHSQTLKYIPARAKTDGTLTPTDQPNTLQYIPVRAKMDTACDYNLISTDIIHRSGITTDQIQELNEELELIGLGGVRHTLNRKVTLTWYLKRHMKSRVGDFYIVDDEYFDVVLGSLYWSGSGTGSALILHGPWKPRAKKEKEAAEHEENMKEARRVEEERSRNDLEERLRKQRANQSVPNGVISGPSNTNTQSPV